MEPAIIEAEAQRGDWVVGWKLAQEDRARLLERLPPRYPSTVADHVTLKPRVDRGTPLPDDVAAAIVGKGDDGRGVEAYVVEVDGSAARPGGGTYHITWSLGPGRKPRESNDVLGQGWTPLPEPIPIRLVPARFR